MSVGGYCMPQCTCGGQKTTCTSHLSPLPCGWWGSILACQVWPTEPSHCPKPQFLLLSLVCQVVVYTLWHLRKNAQQVLWCVCFYQNYLRKFYHLPSNQFRSARNATMIAEKLKEMQRFFGLPETGKPDAATIEIMEKPRCGVPDSGDFLLTPGSPKWTHTNLTYRWHS